jgi:hypothetical protein
MRESSSSDNESSCADFAAKVHRTLLGAPGHRKDRHDDNISECSFGQRRVPHHSGEAESDESLSEAPSEAEDVDEEMKESSLEASDAEEAYSIAPHRVAPPQAIQGGKS